MEHISSACPKCGSKNVKVDNVNGKCLCLDCSKKYRVKNKSVYGSAKKVAVCGVFGGLALVLYLVEVFRIPMGFLFSAAPFLKLNFSDVPIMIAGFCYGPITGGLIVIVKILTKCLITHTGFTGELADLIVSLAYIVPAAVIYMFGKTKKGAVIGLTAGTLISAIAACFTNYYILLPMYGVKSGYEDIIFAGVLPFNLLKSVLVSVIVFLIYKKISNVINKYGAR